MRLEWLVLLACCLLGAWLFYDEEPVFDLTDLGLLQSLCLLAAAVSVFWENAGRANAGYYTSRDRQLGLWALTFFGGLENYFRIVVLGFFAHALAPLWVDQCDSVTLYAYLVSSHWVVGVQVTSVLTLTLAILYATPRIPAWLPLLVILGGGLASALGDLAVSGLTSSGERGAQPTPYGFTPSACTYEARVGGGEFEWHKGTTLPNTFFFLDVASTFYSLLLLVSSLVLVYFLAVGILGHATGGHSAVSYGYRAGLLRLLEHLLVGVVAGLGVVVFVGLRLGFEHYTIAL